jgi:hypothetical protein
MEPLDLLAQAAEILDGLGIEYLITGSVGSMAYGEYRSTNDIDIVIRVTADSVRRLCRAFPEGDFYVNEDAAVDAARRAAQFNVIHPASRLKIDFMVADKSEFNQSRFARRRVLHPIPNRSICFSAPEDIILKKLEFYREGGSDKHLRDIRSMLKILRDNVDRAYIERWAVKLRVEDEWRKAIN